MRRLIFTLIILFFAVLIFGAPLYLMAQPQDYGVELLIYDKDHWLDDLSPTQLQDYYKSGKVTKDDYDNRTQRGDIIEIRKWPFFSVRDPKGWGGHAFRVIVVKGITVEQAKALHLGERNEDGSRTTRILNGKVTEVQTVNSINDITISAKL